MSRVRLWDSILEDDEFIVHIFSSNFQVVNRYVDAWIPE